MLLRIASLELAMPSAHHCFIQPGRPEYLNPLLNVHLKAS
jgi:hypothetical protein